MKLKLKTYEIHGCGQHNQGIAGTIKARTKARAEKKLGEKFMLNHILKVAK